MTGPFRGRRLNVPIDAAAQALIPSGRGAPIPGAPPRAPDYFAGRALQVFPPDYFPPPGAQELYRSVDFASAAAGTLEPAGLVTQLPPGSSGVIRVVGYGVFPMTAATDLTWSVVVNGAVVAGWARRIFARVLPSVNVSEDAYIRIPDGGQVRIRFLNTDGAAYTVNATYSGWFYSTADALRWTGGQG